MQWIATELEPMVAAADEAIEAALAQTKELRRTGIEKLV